MAKRFTSTVQLRRWKQHTCVGCGSTYAYVLERKVVGQGGTAQKAQAAAEKRIGVVERNETDLQACPGCGLYQPDMIGARQARRRLQIMWIALLLFVVILIVRAADGLQANVLACAMAGLCGLTLLANLLIELRNPNNDLPGNAKRAQDQVAAAKLQYAPGTPGGRPDQFARTSRSTLHVAALGLLVASVILAAAPEILRSSRGWALNPKCYPPVVGPADTTRIYMPESATSIKSNWRGEPTVKLYYPGGPIAGRKIEAVTNQSDWGSTIYAKSDEKENKFTPWVKMTLPDIASLAGQTVRCDVNLALEYPQVTGDSKYRIIQSTMHDSLDLRLSPRQAGKEYDGLWWSFTLLSGMLIIVCSLILYSRGKALQATANPVQVAAV